jgi:hypothetical protein
MAILFISFLFVTTALSLAQTGSPDGNSVCAQWCSAHFPNPGKICTAPAAHGMGPCYICGPLKTSPSEQQLCGIACTDTNSDSSNCGSCGNVCASGICVNGACSCNGASCGGIQSCSGDCFCFRGSSTAGFCGENTPCDEDPDCASDADCAAGSMCAIDTCCGRSICLGVCTGSTIKPRMRFDERGLSTNADYPAGVAPV